MISKTGMAQCRASGVPGRAAAGGGVRPSFGAARRLEILQAMQVDVAPCAHMSATQPGRLRIVHHEKERRHRGPTIRVKPATRTRRRPRASTRPRWPVDAKAFQKNLSAPTANVERSPGHARHGSA
ncbi:MAG TPA: hypothetical protein VIP05_22305, partial [Burkholderiaceae bacterium]